MVCEFCKDPIKRGQSVGYRIRGWEIARSSGGTNHILGKERQPNRVVHATCLQARLASERMGLRDQMSLG